MTARLVFFAALTVHLTNIFFLNKNFPLFKPQQGTDQFFYEQSSASIANGDFAGEVLGGDKAPAYPYFLAAVRKVTGGRNLPLVAGVAQSFIFSFNAVFVFLIARRLFGDLSAFLAASMIVLYGPLVLYDSVLLRDSTIVFLDLAALYFLIESVYIKERSIFRIMAAGVFAGLSFLTKESAFAFVIPAAVWLYFKMGRRSLIFAAVFAAVVIPGILRASFISNKIVLFTERSGGMVFYCWNSPESFGHHWACPPQAVDEYYHLKNNGAGALIKKLAGKIMGYPVDYLKLYIRKICAFWWDYEIPNNLNYYLAREYSPVLKFTLFSFMIIGPLGLIGALFALKKNAAGTELLYLYLFYVIISTLIFTVVDRYRMPAVPALIIFSSFAVVSLWELIKRINKPSDAALPASVIAAFFILVFLLRSPVKQKIRINDYMMMAAACESQGYAQEARKQYRLAAACPPDEYMARLDEGLDAGYRDFYWSMKRRAQFCSRK